MRKRCFIYCNIYCILLQAIVAAKTVYFQTGDGINRLPVIVLHFAAALLVLIFCENISQNYSSKRTAAIVVLWIVNCYIMLSWRGDLYFYIISNFVMASIINLPNIFFFGRKYRESSDGYNADEGIVAFCTSQALYFILYIYLYLDAANIFSIIVSVLTIAFNGVLRAGIIRLYNLNSDQKIKMKQYLLGVLIETAATGIALFMLPFSHLSEIEPDRTATIYILRLALIAILFAAQLLFSPILKIYFAIKN